jgi:hypothetical protein
LTDALTKHELSQDGSSNDKLARLIEHLDTEKKRAKVRDDAYKLETIKTDLKTLLKGIDLKGN